MLTFSALIKYCMLPKQEKPQKEIIYYFAAAENFHNKTKYIHNINVHISPNDWQILKMYTQLDTELKYKII